MESAGPQDGITLELIWKQRIGKVKRLAHPGHCLRLPALHPDGTCAAGQTCCRNEIQAALVEDLQVQCYVFSHLSVDTLTLQNISGILPLTTFPGWALESLLLGLRSGSAEILSRVVHSSQFVVAVPHGSEKEPGVCCLAICVHILVPFLKKDPCLSDLSGGF